MIVVLSISESSWSLNLLARCREVLTVGSLMNPRRLRLLRYQVAGRFNPRLIPPRGLVETSLELNSKTLQDVVSLATALGRADKDFARTLSRVIDGVESQIAEATGIIDHFSFGEGPNILRDILAQELVDRPTDAQIENIEGLILHLEELRAILRDYRPNIQEQIKLNNLSLVGFPRSRLAMNVAMEKTRSLMDLLDVRLQEIEVPARRLAEISIQTKAYIVERNWDAALSAIASANQLFRSTALATQSLVLGEIEAQMGQLLIDVSTHRLTK